MRAATRVNVEQASKRAMRRPTRRNNGGRLPPAGKRATRAPVGSAGVMTAARMEEGGGGNTGSPVGGGHAPTGTREGQAGPAGWRRGPQYRGCRVMPAEGTRDKLRRRSGRAAVITLTARLQANEGWSYREAVFGLGTGKRCSYMNLPSIRPR